MKDALTHIVSLVVDDPESVLVTEVQNEGTTQFVIHVAKDDMGKVIGKSGKVIRAIRNVMKIPAIKQGVRIDVTLEEQQ